MHMDRAKHEPEDLETYKVIERNFIGLIIRVAEEIQQNFIDKYQIAYENGFWYKNGIILHLSDIQFEPCDKELGNNPTLILRHMPRLFNRFHDPNKKDDAEITHEILQYAHLMVEKMKQRALVRTLEDTLIEQTPDLEEEEESAPTLATMEAAAVVPESQVELQSNIMTTAGDNELTDGVKIREETESRKPCLSSLGPIRPISGRWCEYSDDEEEQASNDGQVQQQESEPSPSHSNESAKTNNDIEDNNNNPDTLDDHDQEVLEESRRSRSGRVRKMNRTYEDFYCMKPKKGGRLGSHNEYYEVFAPATPSASRSTNRRSTIESRSSESLGNPANTSEVVQEPSKPAGDSTELIAPIRYCKKCRKRTAHDLDRKCQVCLYKRIQSASKRQETLRLKAQATATAAATGIVPDQQQDEVKEAEQSRATSASSSVANTPTSLDGSLLSANGGGSNSGGSGNKRKARSQGGRSSKQPAATSSSLPVVHDTEDTDMPIANSIPTANQTVEHTNQNKVDEPEPIGKDPEAPQDLHNTSSGSDATIDTNITGSSSTSGGSSSSTATTSGNTSASSTGNTQPGATAKQQTPPTTNTLKITTTLKTDERGKKRWVVKSSSGSGGTQNSENAPASVQRESDLPSSQASNVADVPPSEPEPAKTTPVNMRQDDIPSKQSSKVASIEHESMATKKPSETRSGPMEKSNGVSKADNNTIINNPSQTKGDDSQNQPQLTKVDIWTPEDVAQYVSSRGFSDASELFKVQAVDGMSLLLMKRTDFTHGLKMKLGPALKLFDQVCKLKREYFALSATAS